MPASPFGTAVPVRRADAGLATATGLVTGVPGGVRGRWNGPVVRWRRPSGGSVARAMNASETTVLVTLTGRDRPGVTSRLFTALAAEHGLSVLDIEQVVIGGRLVLGVLLACGPDPDLTSIHRGVRA